MKVYKIMVTSKNLTVGNVIKHTVKKHTKNKIG